MKPRTFRFVGKPAASVVAVHRKSPSPQRAKVLAFIRGEVEAGRKFPTSIDISKHMGWLSSGSGHHAMMGLVRDGWLKLDIEHDCGRRYVFRLVAESDAPVPVDVEMQEALGGDRGLRKSAS